LTRGEELHGASVRTTDDGAVTVGTGYAAALEAIDTWGAEHASAAVIEPKGLVASRGDPTHHYRWASVTKPLTALAVLIAAEHGLLDLDEPAGPPGATVRHLLAHASGLAFEGDAILARPGTRRIYSNPAFDALGALVAERAGVAFDRALADWILDPLGMGRPGSSGGRRRGSRGRCTISSHSPGSSCARRC
jgi:CubicO group peptidase (beta-lactamase class C family)